MFVLLLVIYSLLSVLQIDW